MSGPQFFHTQSFARKANPAGQSVQQVIDELCRRQEYATHVENPQPPELLFGMDVEALKSAHDAMIENGKTTVTMADGKKRSRAIRTDRHTLWTVVASYPVPRATIQADTTGTERVLFDRWKQLNIDYLQDKYGEHLKSVFEHVDETFGHIHAYVLPECFEDLNARNFNPAYCAKMATEREAEAAGAPPRLKVKLGNQAYRARATEMADEYYEKVGQPAGLTREGPKRRRLSRSEWRKEKSNARAASRQALQAAEDTMLEELEPLRKALEAVRAHRTILARQQAAEATEQHREDAVRIICEVGSSQRDRFAAAYAVLHNACGEIGKRARDIWAETLPDKTAPEDFRDLKATLHDLTSADFYALSDAVEDAEPLATSLESTKNLLHYVRDQVAKGLAWSVNALREFGRKIADAFVGCVDALAKRLAEEQAVPESEVLVPDAASPFLQLPEDAQKAIEKAFPEPNPKAEASGPA
jgi:hypothetical protein